MIRYVLAAVLAAALLGVSIPAIQDAAAERTASRLSRFGADLDRSAARLRTESDPVRSDAEGGRHVVSLTMPRASLTTAPIRFVELCSSPGGRMTLSYAVGNRPPARRHLTTTLRVRGGAIQLTKPGRHVVELRYHTLEGDDVVTASTPEASNTGTEPSAACDSSSDSTRTTPDGAGATRPFGPRWVPPTP